MPSSKELDGFERWLIDRGRSDGTASAYRRHVKVCDEERSLTRRLLDKKYAPKTRHAYLAALAAWAKYRKDDELVAQLEDIRLPPAQRVQVKVPIPADKWRALVLALKSTKLAPGISQIILLMAIRGPRIGDVLRIRRKDVQAAMTSGVLTFEAKGAKRMEFQIAAFRPMLEELLEIPGWTTVRDLAGKPTSDDRVINTRIARALRRVGKTVDLPKVYPHQLRRTYATQFLKAHAGDGQALQKLTSHMRWASISTAASYTDEVSRTELDAAGAKMIEDLLEP